MLTPTRIARLAQNHDWEVLLAQVLDNGRPLPRAARERLAEPSCVRAAAAALGLCRTLELTRGSLRSATPDAGIEPLLDALRESTTTTDPVARMFAHSALAAVGSITHDSGEAPDQGGGERGALSGEGSPLDTLLMVWALGGMFHSSGMGAFIERSDLGGAFALAARQIRAMDQHSSLAADLRTMLALASIALRRVTLLRPAA